METCKDWRVKKATAESKIIPFKRAHHIIYMRNNKTGNGES